MLFTVRHLNAQTFTYNCLQESCGGLCYTFASPYQSGTTNIWDFGDGTVLTTTEVTVTHCYTNVDTYSSINTSAHVTLNATGQQQQEVTLHHGNCQQGVFIGASDGTTTTYLTAYSVMPGNGFNGSNHTEDVYVYAPVIIDKSYAFQSVDIFMRPAAGFNHILPYAFYLNDANIGITQGCNCQWRGILVSSGVFYSKNNTTINDATIGIVYRGGFLLDIQQTSFINNYIGLFAMNVPSGLYLNLNYSGNTISSSGTLPDYCGGGIFESPYAFSQNTFDDSRTFAGIYLIGVNTPKIGQNIGSLNTFTGLANGVILRNSSAGSMTSPGNISGGISNCRFLNIQRGAYPASIGGYGIYFAASEPGHFMKQEGTGMNNTTTPAFDACEVGVFGSYPGNGANADIVDVRGNEVTVADAGTAIFTDYPGGVLIRENNLTVGDNLGSDGIFLAGGTFARFELYPNPTSGITYVSYHLKKDQTGELTVLNVAGKQVAAHLLNSGNGVVQLDNLPAGIYFIRLSVNGRILQTEKLVKH